MQVSPPDRPTVSMKVARRMIGVSKAQTDVVGGALFLHYRALCTAASVLFLVLETHLILWLTAAASTTGVSRHVLVVFPNLAYDVVESVVNVNARFGRRLDEFAAKLPREIPTLC